MTNPIERLWVALADRYAVERELGHGGMATVYLAQDLKHHRPVAIKVLRPELAEALGTERFLREIETTARLSHPHILPLHDSGAVAGCLFYVMPFVEGESLRSRLARERQLPLEDALRITQEVAGALSYAHSRGVVHRDVKPENILLSEQHALVADFGIARAISAAGGEHLTETGLAIGTPAYMSPEQATGAADVDARSDQYSLACVLYELLVGEPPFTGATAQAIMARHSLDDVSPPSIVRSTVPPAVEDALLRALAKAPADRFPTTQLFAEALTAGLKPTTVGGGRPRRSRRVGPLRTRWWPAAGVAVVITAGWWGWRQWASRSASGTAAGPDPTHVAVLYFTPRGGFPGAQYLADGLTETLIHELSGVTALTVISANGVRPYRNMPVAPDSIGRALQVRTIVQGTLARERDLIRLDVAMIDASSNAEIKSTTLSAPRTALFALQDTLARSVAWFLRAAIGQEIQLQQSRAGATSQAAWELVQQAEERRRNVDPLLTAGDTTAATRELASADSLLVDASAADRRWIAPIVGRGWLAFDQRHIKGFEKGAASAWTGRGLQFADQALRLKPDDAEALRLRGTIRYVRWLLNLDPAPLTANQLLAAAERDLRAGAAADNPNRAAALELLSHLLFRKSETAEGKLVALEAYETDPYLTEASSLLYRLFSGSADLEDGAEAARWCHEGYRRFPDEPFFTECQIILYALPDQRPDIGRVWQLLERNVGQYPPNQREFRRRRDQLFVAFALIRAGLKDSARAVASRSRADATVDPVRELTYFEVMVRNLLGDREEALRLLTLYLATNPQDRTTIAKDETWWWRGLRDDPRFKALVRGGR